MPQPEPAAYVTVQQLGPVAQAAFERMTDGQWMVVTDHGDIVAIIGRTSTQKMMRVVLKRMSDEGELDVDPTAETFTTEEVAAMVTRHFGA